MPLKSIILVCENFIDIFMYNRLLMGMNIADKVLEFNNSLEVINYLKIMHELNNWETQTNAALLIFNSTISGMDVWQFIEHLQAIYSDQKHATKFIIVSETLNRNEIEQLKSEKIVAGFINEPLNRDVILNCFRTIPELRHVSGAGL